MRSKMEIELKHGNIFNANTKVIVNTVNCVGVMGKGIALVFKLRYPKMFDLYKEHCKNRRIAIGKLWLYKEEVDKPWVLNFPTKVHWKYPSKIEYIKKGLQSFLETYKEMEITSIAFPLLGTYNGGLDKNEVFEVMNLYLSKCDIPIEIYEYDAAAPDDLFNSFAQKWKSIMSGQIQKHTGIRIDRIKTISSAIDSGRIKSMIGLIDEPGIGFVTLEKCFSFVMKEESQGLLFD